MTITLGIDWRTAKGWLTDSERELLFHLASQAGEGALIINIGVEYGASVACLRAGNTSAKILAFDIDTSKVLGQGYGAKLLEMSSYSAEAFAFVQKTVRDSGRELSLIFVDGDHGKFGVLQDAKYADYLHPGGYILFQDCWDWGAGAGTIHPLVPGVNQAVVEWFATHKDSFEELPSVGTTRVFRRLA